ncbi:hypothetical protein DICVIV_06923 [Dictyocaulus viviparus]|uniref:Uncharacterized protein n=1 Tax=Dictyocaulus viviparus TaxID=29172 RepID=A0A0D8XQQ1_DICVI|nr:hypothetical protein DICVIV_06923 [Dictyocaulus viviparus]
MIRSVDKSDRDRLEQKKPYGLRSDVGDSLSKSAIDTGVQYGTEQLPPEGEHIADIDYIADEVEIRIIYVEDSVANEWDNEASYVASKSLVPHTLLLTNGSFNDHRKFCGKRDFTIERESCSSQWIGVRDFGDIPSTASGSNSIQGMKYLFKMYGRAALQKAEQTDLLEVNDCIVQKGEEALLAPPPIAHANLQSVVSGESECPKVIPSEASQIYSRKKHYVYNYHKWPLYSDRPIDFQEACHILTGAVTVHEDNVCTSIPQGFRGEGTFVVNCENLYRSDSNNDGLGCWGRPIGRNRYYGHSSNGIFTRMDDGRGNLLPHAKYIWKCMMRRYEHPMTANVDGGQNRFIKKIYSALYPPGRKEVVSFVIFTYEWIGKPFDFRVVQSVAKNRRVSQMFPHPPAGSKDWQAASFQGCAMTALPSNCAAYFGDCPLYAVGAIDFNAVASIILGGTIVETSKYYKIDDSTGDAVRVDRGCKLIEGAEYDVQILSKRYEHPAVNGRFVRKIYTARSPTNVRVYESCFSLAVMTYYWKGEPEPFEAGPQRRVRISGGTCKSRSLDTQCEAIPSSQKCFTVESSPPTKRQRKEEDEDLNSTQAILYRAECELQERQAALLDRFEAFMDRLERISTCLPHLPSMQQVWTNGTSHGNENVAHEEIILDDGAYNEDYVSNLMQ